MNNRNGQSIIEYLILVAAVIVAMMVFLGRGGVFEQSLNSVATQQTGKVSNLAGQIFF